MRDPKREKEDRTRYVNLPKSVSINYCTKEDPMPAGVGPKASSLKQLWIHDDADETEFSKEMDCSTMWLHCPNCKYTYSAYLGD